MNPVLPHKKRRFFANLLPAVLAATSFASTTAHAQTTLNWDGSMTGTGPSTGSNIWDAGTTLDWYPGTGTGDTVWVNGDNAVFAGTGTGGTVTIATGGVTASNITFNTPGYTITGGGLTINPGSTIALNSGTETIGSTITVAAVNNAATAINTSGTGTLILTAPPAFTGVVNVTGGSTLQLGNGTATTAATSASNSANIFNLSGGSTLVYNDNSEGTETTFVQGAGNVTYLGFSGGYLNLNGTATNTGTTTVNLTNGITNHPYDDTLYVNSATALSPNAVLNVLSGNLLMRNSDTVAGLTGNGGFVTTDQNVGNRLTANVAAGQTYTYAGVIGQSTLALAGNSTTTNANVAFGVAGSGVQIISGTANTYTGGSYIEGGTFELTGTLAAGSPLRSDGINGTFDLNGSATTAAKTQSLAATFMSGEGTVQETLGTASSVFLTLSSEARTAGAVANFTTVGGVNGTTVGTTITGQAAGFIDQGTFFNLGKASGASYAVYDTSGATGYVRAFNYATDAGGSVVATGAMLGTTTAASHVETTGAITAQTTATVGTVQMAGATGANILTIGSGQTLTAAGVLLSGTGSGDTAGAITGAGTLTGGTSELVLATNQAADRLTVSTPVAGTGGITQGGPGTVILTGANTYSGTTAVAGGTLQIGNGTAGSLATGYAGNFVTGGNLTFNLPASSTTFTGGISGRGNVVQSANTVIFTGTNAYTYTGATTVGAGATLQFGNGTGTTINGFASPITVASGGNLIFNDNGNENLFTPISGAGNVTFTGQSGGYIGLNTPLTNTGTLTVNLTAGAGGPTFPNGTMFVNGNNILSANSVLNVLSGVVDIREALNPIETVAGLSGTGGFVTTDGGRTAVLNIAPATGTSNTYSGTIGLPNSGFAPAGTFSVSMSGAGTQVLSGTNTYTGTTTVNGTGTLLISGTNSGTGAVAVSSGTLQVTGSIAGSAVTVTGGTFQGTNTGILTATLTATGGTVAPGGPGATPGRMEVSGNVSISNASLSILLNGPGIGASYSTLLADGNLTLGTAVAAGSTADLQLSVGYRPAIGQVFDLAQVQGNSAGVFTSVNGTTTTLTDGSEFTVSGVTFMIGYSGSTAGGVSSYDDGGSDVVLQVLTVVPEPSTNALIFVTGIGAALMLYRRRHASLTA